jgi:hypothetical protein
MIKNERPQSPEDEYAPDWSHYDIQLDEMRRKRVDLLNNQNYKEAHKVCLAIDMLELELTLCIRKQIK